MKNVFLLSFLILIFSCTDDDDPTEPMPTTERTNVTLNISQVDGYSTPSCPDISDTSYLLKDNSLISGVLGSHGAIPNSNDNVLNVFSCLQSSNGNTDFFLQRFGGIFTTEDNSTFSFEGRLEINRSTHEVRGFITISNADTDASENYNVSGTIYASGSCRVSTHNIRSNQALVTSY